MAQDAPAASPEGQCIGYSKCPEVSFQSYLDNPDKQRVDAIDATLFQQGLQRARQGSLTELQGKILLGQLVIYDTRLSVNQNQACASCHTETAGYTGGISAINRENVNVFGSQPDRSGPRKPMSYAYAPYAPVLHYRPSTGDFVGGNFWDMRATGLVTGNPAGDQALDPPVGPPEMGNPDPACIVYRIAQGPYRALFESVWGAQSFAIDWPANTEQACSTPIRTLAPNPMVLDLSAADRQRSTETYNDMGRSAAYFEASSAGSPFSSKFDAYLAGKAALTSQEQQGYALFTGKANCSQCHVAAGARPLFTDFTAVNLGIPRNRDVPYLHENRPDRYGFVENPTGPSVVDDGVGAFLAGPTNTNPDWKALAPKFMGTFQVATARDADRRPRPSFVKAYMHNGYFKSLRDVVHFYNTRDVLARCGGDYEVGQNGAGMTCWPAPEQPANENTTQLGNLGLSADEEAAVVAFLGTLSDGFQTP